MQSYLTLIISVSLLKSQLFASGEKEVPKAVAFYCGRPALYLTAAGWQPDHSTDCLQQEKDIIEFCRKIYPGAAITNASFSPVIEIPLRGWCHPRNSSCLLENPSIYRIQPWICSAQKPPIIVPAGCHLEEFGGPNNTVCQKAVYWTQLASTRCLLVRQVQHVKPCIKPDSYLHNHYLGVLAVCCAVAKAKVPSPIIDNAIPGSNIQPHQVNYSLPFSVVADSRSSQVDDSLVIDQNVAIYRDYLNEPTATSTRPTTEGDKLRERQRYNVAKKAGHEAYHRRKHTLEQELAEAEAQLSNEDWIRNPEQTQEAENRLHKEFRRKYLALEQEARATEHDLLMTHQQRVSHSMGKRFETAAAAWDKAVRTKPSNLTHLLTALEHLQRVVERDRYHLIWRWERLQNTDPIEASRTLGYLRGRLDDVERRFNQSLEKLNEVPLLKDAILHQVTLLRDREYPQLDAMVKSLHHARIPEADGVQLPTPTQQAALEAEAIIAKYRHHLPKMDLDKRAGKANGKPEQKHLGTKPIRISEENNVLPGKAISKMMPPISQLKLEISPPGPTTPSVVVKDAKTDTMLIPQTHSTQSGPVTPKQLINPPPPQRSSTAAKWLLSLTAIAFVILVTLFVLRYRIRRARLRRAGYSCTVAEVDEITTVNAPHVNHAGGLSDDESERLTNWRLNGYENPAYKFPDNVVRFPRV